MKCAVKWTAGTALLLCGGAVYVLFRPDTLLLFRAIDWFSLTAQTNHWREATSESALPEWFIYSLPAGLWVTAYILIVDAIHHSSSRRVKLCTASFIPLLGLLSEILQGCGWLPGTFDWLDLAAYLIPLAIYSHIIYNKRTWNLQANK
ncbi:MAG: hypothetical protein IJV06_06795 [Bacteroidaceae bacterium]|nr:hypothetical protein [Bacteroidaceae bacterium]